MTLPNCAKCASICSSSSPAVQAGQHCQLLQQQRPALLGGADSVRVQGVRLFCACHFTALCTGKSAW